MTHSVNTKHLAFSNADLWRDWLAQHHTHADEAWLIIAKKGFQGTITIDEALDVALCYGWIDSQRKGLDEQSYLQRYSRRTARSPWSMLNVERAHRLIAAGLMMPPGLAEIAAAKEDGRWDAAYEPQRDAKPPSDFLEALKQNEGAQTNYLQLDKSARYAIFLPILKATNASARSSRIRAALQKLRGS